MPHREGVELLTEVLSDALSQKRAGTLALVPHALESQVHEAEPHCPQLNFVRLQRPASSVLLTAGESQVQRRHHGALVIGLTSGTDELHQAEFVVRTAHAASCLDEGSLDRQGRCCCRWPGVLRRRLLDPHCHLDLVVVICGHHAQSRARLQCPHVQRYAVRYEPGNLRNGCCEEQSEPHYD